MAYTKLFQKLEWHNDAPPAINEDNLNRIEDAIDELDDRVVAMSGSISSSGGIQLQNTSGWTHKEEMEDVNIPFQFNWSGSNGGGTLILDKLGSEIDRVSISQGNVSYTIKATDIGPVGEHNLKIYVIDSSGDIKCIPLSFKIKSNDTWALAKGDKVIELLQKHYAGEIDIHDYWSIGDVRKVNISAITGAEIIATDTTKNIPSQPSQEIELVLANVGYDGYKITATNSAPAFVVCQRKPLRNSVGIGIVSLFNDSMYNQFKQNWSITTGRKLSDMYYAMQQGNGALSYNALLAWLENKYYESLPDYMQSIIKPVSYNYQALTYNNGNYYFNTSLRLNNRKVFIPAAKNIIPNQSKYPNALPDDNTYWKFFSDLRGNADVYRNTEFGVSGGTSDNIVTRTVDQNFNPSSYFIVMSRLTQQRGWQSGTVTHTSGGNVYYVMPAFCI